MAKLNQDKISRIERGISTINLPDFVRVMMALEPDLIKDILPESMKKLTQRGKEVS
jgi:hypothetical protein